MASPGHRPRRLQGRTQSARLDPCQPSADGRCEDITEEPGHATERANSQERIPGHSPAGTTGSPSVATTGLDPVHDAHEEENDGEGNPRKTNDERVLGIGGKEIYADVSPHDSDDAFHDAEKP